MREKIEQCLTVSRSVFLGKDDTLLKAYLTFFSGGHLLIEDVPGVGKTTLALLISTVLGKDFARIQMTSDLMPSDILGSLVYDSAQERFKVDKGPIFNEILLADELNRAGPKTQSAFLQAMEEKAVTIDNQTFQLDEHFFVVATQNPLEQYGTFPLPESHLDRFDICLNIGHLHYDDEMALLKGENRRKLISTTEAVVTSEEITEIRREMEKIHISDEVYALVLNVLNKSRSVDVQKWSGLSPRMGITLVKLMKARAYYDKRSYVVPEDLIYWITDVMNHRLFFMQDSRMDQRVEWVKEFISDVI